MTVSRCVLHAVAGAAMAVVATAPAVADMVTVGAMLDNTLYRDTAGLLSNGAGQHFFAGNNGNGDPRRGLLAFDVAAAVPAGATITGVTLTLNMSRGDVAPIEVGLHRVLSSWGEGTTDADGNEGAGGVVTAGSATWLHRFHDGVLWGTPGGDFVPGASATAAVGGLGAVSWSSAGMAADVQAWLDGGEGNYGWALIGGETVNSTSKRFDSRENPVESLRPRLVVEYVPAPGPAALGLIGAAMIAGRRRRRDQELAGR